MGRKRGRQWDSRHGTDNGTVDKTQADIHTRDNGQGEGQTVLVGQ